MDTNAHGYSGGRPLRELRGPAITRETAGVGERREVGDERIAGVRGEQWRDGVRHANAVHKRRCVVEDSDGLAPGVGVPAHIGQNPSARNKDRACAVGDRARDSDGYVRGAAIIKRGWRVEGPGRSEENTSEL